MNNSWPKNSPYKKAYEDAALAYMTVVKRISGSKQLVKTSERMYDSPGPQAAALLRVLQEREHKKVLVLEAEANELAHAVCRAHYTILAVEIAEVGEDAGVAAYDEDITTDVRARRCADHVLEHLTEAANSSVAAQLLKVLSA